MDLRQIAKHLTVPVFGTGVALTETAIYKHRALAHHSVELGETATRVAQVIGAPFADSKPWAAVHRGPHHGTPDTNLYPFVQIADYLDWRHMHEPESHPNLPESFDSLDPTAKQIPLAEVQAIGSLARRLVEGRYKPKDSYTSEEATEILADDKPRYFYEPKGERPKPKNLNEPQTLEDVKYLLRDPHSPALHPKGILGVWVENIPLYSVPEKYFKDARNRPGDLQPDKMDTWLRDHRKHIRWAFVGTVILANLALHRPKTPKQLVVRTVEGAAQSGLITLGLLFGGNTTNAWGHAGKLRKSPRALYKDLKNGVVRSKPDGTYTTNTKLFSAPTLDEVGGQKDHHDRPQDIAYTNKKGLSKLLNAPYGTAVEYWAKAKLLIRRGKGFPEHKRRPDMPNEAVLLIEAARRRSLAAS